MLPGLSHDPGVDTLLLGSLPCSLVDTNIALLASALLRLLVLRFSRCADRCQNLLKLLR